MPKFSVLLLYPDYLANQYGEETFFAHVVADNKAAAIQVAQVIAEGGVANDGAKPEDFLPLLVLAGHHDDLGVL
ncbi:MAG TPA: hypothetical protein VJ396_09430 [Acidiferrobacterales bacterium]|nr:hypothetical protein [Acidiferrobacterales bacterium]